MRLLFFISIIWTNLLVGQVLTKKQVDSYVKTVDSLKTSKKLKRYRYPEMSFCGGSLYGYYFDKQLIYIDATFSGELGFTRKQIYLKDTVFYKVIFQEYFPEWDKYYKKFAKDSLKDIDANKMTYSDTLYTIILTEPPTCVKTAAKKVINKNVDLTQMNNLIECGRRMKKELETEKILH